MNRDILSKIEQEQMISREELEELLTTTDQELIEELYRRARATAGKYYGKEIYLRGLIEFTNYCKNNCYYCGIRCGNEKEQQKPTCSRQCQPAGIPRRESVGGCQLTYFWQLPTTLISIKFLKLRVTTALGVPFCPQSSAQYGIHPN